MEETHKVKIKAVSFKTRGIKVEKDGKVAWIDLSEDIDIKSIRKGEATITIDLRTGKPLITKIGYEEQSPQEIKGSEQLSEEDIKWLKKDKRISRLALLNTSVEIYKLYGGEIDFSRANEKGKREKVIKEILEIAKALEKWVWQD